MQGKARSALSRNSSAGPRSDETSAAQRSEVRKTRQPERQHEGGLFVVHKQEQARAEGLDPLINVKRVYLLLVSKFAHTHVSVSFTHL